MPRPGDERGNPHDLHAWPFGFLDSASSYLCLRQLTYNDATQRWSQLDLEKGKNILKCLSLWGREGSSSQMGVAHLCGLKAIARKRRETDNSNLSLIFRLSFAFFPS